MEEKNYYQERNQKNLKKIEALLEELPPFADEYFLGIETQTSTLTRLNYAYDLRIFFHYLVTKRFRGKTVRDLTLSDLENITGTDIERFLSYLSSYNFNGTTESCNERAKARKLSSVRAMFRYFFRKDKIKVDNAAKVSMPKLHDNEIIRLEVNEVADLLNCAEYGAGMSDRQRSYHENTKVRDIAILTLFLGTGIRISELVGLNNESIDFTNNSFVVTRKGGNVTVLYFSEEVRDAIELYLPWRQERLLKAGLYSDIDALFISLQNKRITVRAVENLVKKYSSTANPLKGVSPHKLRSTYGTRLYRETKDIYMVAEVLGHRDVNTTKKHYAAIDEDIKREASTKVVLHKKS